MPRRAAAALAAVFIAFPLAWLAGEQHRENCIHENRLGCSVLPWGNGHRPDPLAGYSPAERRMMQRELDAAASQQQRDGGTIRKAVTPSQGDVDLIRKAMAPK